MRLRRICGVWRSSRYTKEISSRYGAPLPDCRDGTACERRAEAVASACSDDGTYARKDYDNPQSYGHILLSSFRITDVGIDADRCHPARVASLRLAAYPGTAVARPIGPRPTGRHSSPTHATPSSSPGTGAEVRALTAWINAFRATEGTCASAPVCTAIEIRRIELGARVPTRALATCAECLSATGLHRRGCGKS